MNLYLLGSMEHRLIEFAHQARQLDNFEAAQDISDAAEKIRDALKKLQPESSQSESDQ